MYVLSRMPRLASAAINAPSPSSTPSIICSRVRVRSLTRAGSAENEGGHAGAKIGAAVGDGLEALLELTQAGGFLDEAVGASLEHLADEGGALVGGKDEHAGVLELFADAAEDVHAAQARQAGVEHEQVGLQVEAELAGLLAVAALADNLVGRINAEDFREHLTDGGLVLDNDDAFR